MELPTPACANEEWVQLAITGLPSSLMNVHATRNIGHFEPVMAARKDTQSRVRGRSEDVADPRHRLVLKAILRRKPRLPPLNHRFHGRKTTKIALLPFLTSASILRRTH